MPKDRPYRVYEYPYSDGHVGVVRLFAHRGGRHQTRYSTWAIYNRDDEEVDSGWRRTAASAQEELLVAVLRRGLKLVLDSNTPDWVVGHLRRRGWVGGMCTVCETNPYGGRCPACHVFSDRTPMSSMPLVTPPTQGSDTGEPQTPRFRTPHRSRSRSRIGIVEDAAATRARQMRRAHDRGSNCQGPSCICGVFVGSSPDP